MAFKSSIAAIVLLVVLCGVAGADLPATRGSGETPKAVFAGFFQALTEGRAKDIAALCVAKDADSRRMVEDFKKLAGAIGTLRDAATAKFGPGSGALVIPRLASLSDIEAMTETITGDRAELAGDNVGPAELVRSDGHWKLDLSALLHNEAEVTPDAHGYFAALTEAVERTTADIAAARFDSAQSAGEAMLARQEGIAEGTSTTQASPATRP